MLSLLATRPPKRWHFQDYHFNYTLRRALASLFNFFSCIHSVCVLFSSQLRNIHPHHVTDIRIVWRLIEVIFAPMCKQRNLINSQFLPFTKSGRHSICRRQEGHGVHLFPTVHLNELLIVCIQQVENVCPAFSTAAELNVSQQL